MKILKKGLHILVFVIVMLLASFGLGFTNILSGNKERYRDREISRERVDKREEEDSDQKNQNS